VAADLDHILGRIRAWRLEVRDDYMIDGVAGVIGQSRENCGPRLPRGVLMKPKNAFGDGSRIRP
jgi:hypothetical protein